jgi:hypothetical protein
MIKTMKSFAVAFGMTAMQLQHQTADPPFGFAQGRLFEDDNQKYNNNCDC